MQIKAITGGTVTVDLEVGTCLAIASACHLASNTCGDDGLPIHDGIFLALRGAFDALAMVAAAPCHMPRNQNSNYTMEQVRADWGNLPLVLDGKEVAK